jgi:nicotinamide-nucleotide amidase
MRKQKSKIFLSKGKQHLIVDPRDFHRGFMKIGLLIVGNEILEGKISDANTRQLSLFLQKNHLDLSTSLIVSDTLETIQKGLETLFSLCDVVITSGGLGPTKDDVTKEAIASYLGRKISYSEESFNVAKINYDRMGRPFPGKDHGYCFLPEGFVALNNSTGFAPAFFAEHLGKYLLCGAGVPKEFMSLLDDHFLSLVQNRFPLSGELIESFTVRTKKIPEEKIFGEVDPHLWEVLSQFGNVSSLPTTMGVDIGVKLRASNAKELEKKKEKVQEIFKSSPVFSSIWQFGNLSLEEYIVKVANEKNITYGFAESATGGMCSHRITNIPGSSKTFIGSVVSYAESVKHKTLNVEAATLKTHGVVSIQTAGEMSSGLSQQLKMKIAISITGIAGPTGGTEEKPVGTVCFGVTNDGKTHTHTTQFRGDREQLKLRFSQAALFYLLEELEISS